MMFLQMLYENGLRSLAELTSTSIELFRKMAEISLLPDVSKIFPVSINHDSLMYRSQRVALYSRPRSSTD